jgi:hypothetical protein
LETVDDLLTLELSAKLLDGIISRPSAEKMVPEAIFTEEPDATEIICELALLNKIQIKNDRILIEILLFILNIKNLNAN